MVANPRFAGAKALLTQFNLPLDANSLSNGLMLAGVLEAKTYLSTSGTGELKSYLAFTDTGLAYGKNAINAWHEFKTEPKYLEARFLDVYLLAATAVLAHARKTIEGAA